MISWGCCENQVRQCVGKHNAMLAKGRSSKIVRSESCRWEGQTSSFPLLGDPSGFLPGQDVTIASACAPPGGGRNPVTPRFIRHFSMLCLPMPSEHSLKQIFQVSVDLNVGKKGKENIFVPKPP